MKRATLTTLILLVLGCVIHSSARCEPVTVRILFGKREAALAPSPVYDGSRVYAPLSLLGLMGASHVVSSDGRTVSVLTSAGKSADIDLYDVNGTRMIAVDKALDLVGGEQVIDAEKRTLTLKSYLQSVEFVNNTLKVNCSLPVVCEVSRWGEKLIVDIPDTKLTSEAREVYVGGSFVEKARLGQRAGDCARVVLDMAKTAEYRLESSMPSRQIVLLVGENLPKENPEPKPPDDLQPAIQKPAKAPPYLVMGIRVEPVDATSFNVVISTSARASATSDFEVVPPRALVDLGGASLDESFTSAEGSHALLNSLDFKQVGTAPSKVRVALSFARTMVFDTRVTDSSVTISVRPPDKSGGSLAEKLIVIDPGHGGREKGARSGAVFEKDVNLQIANELAIALRAAGARVVMTRDKDVVTGLAARPQVAISNRADLFLSVHCNSNGSPNSTTGIETYYHMQEQSPKTLACFVHDAVCSSTGMSDLKARSDRSLYAPGLKVLRELENSGIPGVLVECGYINNDSDRAKLRDAGYRKKLVSGLVAGLNAYIAGTPIR